jgi:hypothetical protein
VRWTCSRCGKEHSGLPYDWAFNEPAYWEGPRSKHDELTEDLCRWTDDAGKPSYFIRGLLTIPVVDATDDFRYGVWSSLSERSFERVIEVWDDPARVDEDPYFGWLSNALPGYPETLSLALDVVTSSLDLRPEFVLHEANHPLVLEQRTGITTARVREIAELNMHD